MRLRIGLHLGLTVAFASVGILAGSVSAYAASSTAAVEAQPNQSSAGLINSSSTNTVITTNTDTSSVNTQSASQTSGSSSAGGTSSSSDNSQGFAPVTSTNTQVDQKGSVVASPSASTVTQKSQPTTDVGSAVVSDSQVPAVSQSAVSAAAVASVINAAAVVRSNAYYYGLSNTAVVPQVTTAQPEAAAPNAPKAPPVPESPLFILQQFTHLLAMTFMPVLRSVHAAASPTTLSTLVLLLIVYSLALQVGRRFRQGYASMLAAAGHTNAPRSDAANALNTIWVQARAVGVAAIQFTSAFSVAIFPPVFLSSFTVSNTRRLDYPRFGGVFVAA